MLPPLLAILLPLMPGIIDAMANMFQVASSAKETPEELKAHYGKIALALAAVNLLVQNAPEPPAGSGA